MKNLAFVVIGAATLTACATPYIATPYERDISNVESIGILEDAMPEQPRVAQAASAGASYGLIGALVDAGVQANRQGRIDALVEANPVDAEGVMEAALTQKLADLGYNVALVDLSDERPNRKLLESYEQITAANPVDAYLDVVTDEFGYLSAGVGQPWRPSVKVRVRLVSADSGDVLMESMLSYNPLYAQAGWVNITPNPEYNFRDVKEMEANPEKMIAGLEAMTSEVAEVVATLLR